MTLPIWVLILTHLIAFGIGIFVYRNNRKAADPTLEDIDKLWDKIEAKIDAKLQEMKDNKTV